MKVVLILLLALSIVGTVIDAKKLIISLSEPGQSSNLAVPDLEASSLSKARVERDTEFADAHDLSTGKSRIVTEDGYAMRLRRQAKAHKKSTGKSRVARDVQVRGQGKS